MWVESPGSFPTKDTDEWAADWITGRDNRSEKKEAKRADAIAGVVDPKAVAAAAKRAAKREDHVLAGIEHLQLWMKDLVRHGLTQAESRTNAQWNELAARLVDAQAPGLAQIIRDMSTLVGSGAGWH
ncbi:hypothetical protein, partial [Enterococcus faecium]|uniref:hypothetical protein n=1 Tax=Enterococcus faecium TaxID=1352 RepID=UPI001C9CF56F